MIGISSYERNVHVDEKTNIKRKEKRVRPLRQGFCDHRSSHRFAISYRLKSKERWTPRLKNEPHWVTQKPPKEDQGNRMTIQTRRKATQWNNPSPTPRYTIIVSTANSVRYRHGRREGVGQLAAIKLLLWRRVSALPATDPRIGQGVRGLSPKARFLLAEEWEYPVGTLCVSFECDPLSEELRKEETK